VRRRSKRIWLALVVVATGVASVPVVAGWRWEADTTTLAGRLTTRAAGESSVFTAEALRHLPPPVGRYLRHVLPEGQRRIVRADAVQEAEFFVNGAWKPLRATQRFSATPPGFVWDAHIEMAPLLSVYVRDAYVDGEGSMHATMLGLYTLTNQKGRSELDAGALQRYLGEALWIPTVFLTGSGITWAAAGDRAATATITDDDTTVALEFRFNDRDEVVEVVGQRFAEENGAYVLRPWQVLCRDYQRQSGMLIPAFCEVAWQRPEGRVPYWRGRVVQIAYELSR
jgi:Family of unknown function (DUF6920)